MGSVQFLNKSLRRSTDIWEQCIEDEWFVFDNPLGGRQYIDFVTSFTITKLITLLQLGCSCRVCQGRNMNIKIENKLLNQVNQATSNDIITSIIHVTHDYNLLLWYVTFWWTRL